MLPRSIRFALAAFTLSPSITAQTSVRLPVIADATVRSDQPTTNFGSSTELGLAKNRGAAGIYFMRSFFRFDVSSLLGQPIRKATLFFNEERTIAAGGLPVSTYGLTQAFVETSVTWNSRPTDDGRATDSVKVGNNSNRGWKEFDITPLVRSWVGGATNHGVVIRLANESTAGAYRPGWGPSREHATTNLRPYLLVDTTDVVGFNRGCGPVATWPRLQVTNGAPKRGTTMTLTGSLLAPSAPGILAIGISNTTWGGAALPMVLDPTPFPPCQLLVSLDLIVGGRTNSNGELISTINIPNDPRLDHLHLYMQMATLGRDNHLTSGLDLLFH